MTRRTIQPVPSAEFRAPNQPRTLRYVTARGTWSDNAKDAAPIVLYAGSTARERLRMEDLCAQWAGSREKWLEQVAGVTLLTRKVQREVVDAVYPGGRPSPATPAEDAAISDSLESAWAAWSSPTKEAALAFQERVEQLRFFARWVACQVAVPTGWDDLGNTDLLDEEMIMAVWNAVARETEASSSGNA